MIYEYVIMDDPVSSADDLDIQALLDGEVEDGKADRLLEKILGNQDLRKRYLVYSHQKDLLKKWFKDN